MAQILAFVDTDNFGALVGTNALQACNYATVENGNLLKLQGGNCLLYVSADGNSEQGDFDVDYARSAAYLIIPEELGIPEGYEPEQDFAMLVHRTNADLYAGRYNILNEKNYCWALKRDNEIGGSSFALIASQLRPNTPIDFDRAWISVTRMQVLNYKSAFVTDLREDDITTLSLPKCLHSLSGQFAELQEIYTIDSQSAVFEESLVRFRELVRNAPDLPT